MDDIQKKHIELYSNLMSQPLSASKSVGRYEFDSGKDGAITLDILNKMNLKFSSRILDIGSGVGGVTELLMKAFREKNAKIHLMDIGPVIQKIKNESWYKDDIQLHIGVFPESESFIGLPEQFDHVLIYSVLHYTGKPTQFVEAAIKLLAPGGTLFIGDMPNVNKKGRFLASPAGREFEASYKKVPLSQIPVFKNDAEYVKSSYNTQNSAICDAWIIETIQKYRKQGVNVYVLPQPEELPFSKTREDLLFVKEQ